MVAATAKKAENSITVFRRQVIQTGSYEPAEASCSVTITVDADTSEEEATDLITRWGSVLELSNYEALGVGYEIAEDGTVAMLEKSIPGASASGPQAVAPAPAAPPAPAGGGGGSLEEVWRNLMDHQSDWWDPNWSKKMDPSSNFNKKGPDYKRRSDGKGLWLTKQDGSCLVPGWFVCPFTGKTAADLASIGAQIRT
jgi:hypothetical protein|tara:strand:+ start:2347 stop:2937 length:591 start_codon:yes stop_codon:yes gene_type:complete